MSSSHPLGTVRHKTPSCGVPEGRGSDRGQKILCLCKYMQKAFCDLPLDWKGHRNAASLRALIASVSLTPLPRFPLTDEET